MANPREVLKMAKVKSSGPKPKRGICHEVIDRLFTSRNLIHVAHLTTMSYASHKALNQLYDEIIDEMDEFLEMYIAKFGSIDNITFSAASMPKDIVLHITAEQQWLEDNKELISKGVPALKAELDELDAAYLKALYKLKHLN